MTKRAKKADTIAAPLPPKPAEAPIVAINGFDANLQCRGFQFAVGETYRHDSDVIACKSGFHAIEGHPLEVLNYYPLAAARGEG